MARPRRGLGPPKGFANTAVLTVNAEQTTDNKKVTTVKYSCGWPTYITVTLLESKMIFICILMTIIRKYT
jgi:hypothetical protein